MAKFTGSECLVCKEKFTDNDDIVVCPQCGTPYHRECYAEEGSCINTSLHEENKSWSETQKINHSEDELSKKCPFCNHDNKAHTLICEQCGASLVDRMNLGEENNQSQDNPFGQQTGIPNPNIFTFNPNDRYGGINPDDTLDGDVKVSEAADFVGTNILYYLMNFKRMKDMKRKISTSFISLFFSEFYFAYRKMIPEAVITIILKTIIFIPTIIYYLKNMVGTFVEKGYALSFIKSIDIESVSFSLYSTIANYASIAISILAFLFANWLYYRHMQRKINKIKNQYSSQEDISAKIIMSGGTSVALVIFAAAFEMFVTFVTLYGLVLL